MLAVVLSFLSVLKILPPLADLALMNDCVKGLISLVGLLNKHLLNTTCWFVAGGSKVNTETY
jgi:hypothetical protein